MRAASRPRLGYLDNVDYLKEARALPPTLVILGRIQYAIRDSVGLWRCQGGVVSYR